MNEWLLEIFNHNVMMVYVNDGEHDKANEICENYLKGIRKSSYIQKKNID